MANDTINSAKTNILSLLNSYATLATFNPNTSEQSVTLTKSVLSYAFIQIRLFEENVDRVDNFLLIPSLFTVGNTYRLWSADGTKYADIIFSSNGLTITCPSQPLAQVRINAIGWQKFKVIEMFRYYSRPWRISQITSEGTTEEALTFVIGFFVVILIVIAIIRILGKWFKVIFHGGGIGRRTKGTDGIFPECRDVTASGCSDIIV